MIKTKTNCLSDSRWLTKTITFWAENESCYPLLSSLARDMLCIPASLAPVERTFSTAEESTILGNLTMQNLEREMLLCKNRYYL